MWGCGRPYRTLNWPQIAEGRSGTCPTCWKRRMGSMTLQSDALVFFGATGDLAFKQIFPALLALVERHGLNIPIVGVAKAGWDLDQFRQRAEDSLKAHGPFNEDSFEKLIK